MSLRFLAVLGALAAMACGGGGNARLEIELAPTPSASDPQGDSACAVTAEGLPREVECIGVSVCERERDGDCVPVDVLRPEDDHAGPGRAALRFSRVDSPSVTFDVRFEPNRRYELEIVTYDGDGVPYSRGRATGITAGASSIRVRLEPFGRWTCAGPAEGGGVPASRALHQAVTLDTGDVLLLGGVTGDAVAATSVEAGAALQRTIEVYDASDARFHVVSATDTDGAAGFGAVFHQAVYLGRTGDGRHRVRSIGGFAVTGDDPAARFDAIQGLNHYSSPLLPGARADVRDSVDILYDPATRSAQIVSVEPGAVPRAGFDAVSEAVEGQTVVVLGLTDGGGTALRPRPTISGRWYTLAEGSGGSTTSMALLSRRFGATASRLSIAQVLVWGGNVDELTVEDVSARAGELLGSSPGPVASIAGSGLPPATALHTATQIDGGLLIAGGLLVAPVMGMSGGMTTSASSQPLTVVAVDTTSGFVVGTPIDPSASAWESTILHAAVALEDESVVLTGGAVRVSDGTASHLWPRGQAIRVARDGTGVYAAEALPGLIVPRWGHAMAALPNGRVLVTGGFVREGAMLRAISAAEVLVLGARPATIASCGDATRPDASTVRDGGAVLDGGDADLTDGGVGDDAGVLPGDDAGVLPADDAGV